MASFNFSEVAWKETAILNFFRSVAAGIVWFLIYLFVFQELAIFILTAFPIQYLLILAPIGLVCNQLSRFIPFVGLLTLALAALIVVGDPIIFAVTQFKPGLLPVDSYSPFNFVLVIYLLK